MPAIKTPAVNKQGVVLTQAMGAYTQVVQKQAGFYQIYISTSATASAGTLAIEYSCPESDFFVPLLDSEGNAITIDMTAPQPVVAEDVYIEKIRVTPTGFDADKTYNLFVLTISNEV